MTTPATPITSVPDIPTRAWRFDELKRSYNFRHHSGRIELMVGLVADEARLHRRPVRALDIGCGRGIGLDAASHAAVRAHVDELWGIEPDPAINPPAGVFDNFQHALMETADIPQGSVDVAYSSLVMEHVQQPEAFLRAVYRALKPGGAYLFLTINGKHYFARIARTLRALHLDEFILRVIRRQEVEEYHYPLAYKCNTVRALQKLAAAVGFEAPEFVFVERDEPSPYLKGPLRIVQKVLDRKRDLIRKPESLLEMTGRLRKPL
jgi:2-polyprenyl-3-methyl-5-hydroxy-6-metoxy-1,4-benzoquinol methylase